MHIVPATTSKPATSQPSITADTAVATEIKYTK